MLKAIIVKHVKEYRKTYIIISIMFILGICFGVGIINQLNEEEREIIQKYFFEYTSGFSNLNIQNVFLNGILSKSKFVFVLFILACTIIFEKVIYGCVLYKGFSIGYSISASLKVYGIRKGILLSITTLGFQNIIFIPCILFFANYCINFCKIMKNNNVDIKRCYFKLFMTFCVIMIISAISSCLELFFSYKIIKKIQFFY